MSRFIRSAVAMSLIPAIFSTFVGSCATQENRERKAMLSLQYNDFDQTYGTGFCVLYDRGEYYKGAVLIEDYLKAHREFDGGAAKVSTLPCGAILPWRVRIHWRSNN